MRYSTLEELAAAYKAGAVTDPLILDNDCTTVYAGDPEGDDIECVFDMDPHDVMEQALGLLGIPWEHV